jgi:hypothetical protein
MNFQNILNDMKVDYLPSTTTKKSSGRFSQERAVIVQPPGGSKVADDWLQTTDFWDYLLAYPAT